MGAFIHAGTGDGERRVEITGKIVMATERSICVDDGVTRHWLPRSKIEIKELSPSYVAVFMPLWLARKKRYVF